MATKVKSKKPKRFWGALISTAVEAGGAIIEGIDRKNNIEKARLAERKQYLKEGNIAGNRKKEEYQAFLAQHPEMVYGTNKEIQAFGNGEEVLDTQFTTSAKEGDTLGSAFALDENAMKHPEYRKGAYKAINAHQWANLYGQYVDSDGPFDINDPKIRARMKQLGKTDKDINTFTPANYQSIISPADLKASFEMGPPEYKPKNALGTDDPLKTVTKGMQVVDAGSHESGNDVERANDFVEGGETVMGDAVHSNRIDAYSPAQMSASLGTVLDEIARVGKRATGGVKGDLERLGVKLQKKIGEVTDKQEAIKAEYGTELDAVTGAGVKPVNAFGNELPFDRKTNRKINREARKYARQNKDEDEIGFLEGPGGTAVGALADLAVSSIDNIYNANLLKQTPEVPVPNYYSAAPLKTDVDVTEQLSQISDQQDKMDALIDASTASSNTAIQRKRAAATAATKAENTVISEKNKEETRLENRKNLNDQRIHNMNVNLLNAYDDKVVQRKNQILSAKSQNISNLSRDLVSGVDKVRMGQFQNEQLEHDTLKYQDSGVIATTALNGAYDNVSKEDKMQIIETVKNAGRPADVTALKKRWGL